MDGTLYHVHSDLPSASPFDFAQGKLRAGLGSTVALSDAAGQAVGSEPRNTRKVFAPFALFAPSWFHPLTKHYYANGQRVATRVDGSLYYVHSDLLGSTVAVSDAAGQAVGRVQYDPYGEVLTSILPADPALRGEIRALQYFEEAAGIRVYDWAAWEMEAYGWEIENAYRAELSGKEFEEVFQMWQQFRDLGEAT